MRAFGPYVQKSSRLVGLLLICALFFLSGTGAVCCATLVESETDVIVISDIAHWKHPVHQVLIKQKVALSKVVLKEKGNYPVFFVSFPYDPQSSATRTYFNTLHSEVLRANGYWDYSLDDTADKLLLNVSWDKKKKSMSVEFEDTQGR